MFKRKAPLLLQDSTVGAVAGKMGRSPAQVHSKALANLYSGHEVPPMQASCYSIQWSA